MMASTPTEETSLKAQTKLKDELLKTDDETKAAVAEMEQATVLKAQDMAGVTAPLGFFDPFGFTTKLDADRQTHENEQGKLFFYREVEIKHGRVAMLATLGFVVGEQFHPLFGGNIDVPSYVAFQQTPLQTFWPAVVAAIALPEVLFSIPTFQKPVDDGSTYQDQDTWTMKQDGRVPGDIGFDPLGL